MSDTHQGKVTMNGAANSPPRFHVTPDVDLFESETEYLLHVDVPGVRADSIDVRVVGTEVHVRGEQAPSDVDPEAALSNFERKIKLPGEVDGAVASAQLEGGVLEIKIAKSPASRPIKIPVRGGGN